MPETNVVFGFLLKIVRGRVDYVDLVFVKNLTAVRPSSDMLRPEFVSIF